MSASPSASDRIQALLRERPLPLDVLVTAGLQHWNRYCETVGEPGSNEDLALALKALQPYFLCATSALELPVELLWLLADSIDDPVASLKSIGVETGSFALAEQAELRALMSRTTSPLSPKWLPRLVDFGKTCMEYFEQSGDLSILDVFQAYLSFATEEVGESHPNYFHVLRIGAEIAVWRHRQTRTEVDLDSAIERLLEAVESLNDERADHREFVSGFRSVLIACAQHKAESGATEVAFDLFQRIIELNERDLPTEVGESPETQGLYREIAELLRNQGEDPRQELGKIQDIAGKVLELPDTDEEQRFELLWKLGWSSLQMFDSSSGDQGLRQAVTYLEQAMFAATDLDRRDRAARLLAQALQMRFRRTDDPADLRRVEALLKEIRPPGSESKGQADEGQRNAAAARQTLDDFIVPPSAFDPTSYDRMGLGQAESGTLSSLFCELDLGPSANPGMSSELGRALQEFKNVLQHPDDPSRCVSALRKLESIFNECSLDNRDRHEIEHVVLAVKSSVLAETQDTEGLAQILSDMRRHLSDAQSSALRKANGLDRMAQLAALLCFLETESNPNGEFSSRAEESALHVLEDIAEICKDDGAPASVRIEAVLSACRLAGFIGRVDAVTEPLAAAVRLMPQVASAHVRPERRRQWFSRFCGITGDAVALTLAASDSSAANETALELLEIGRNVLHNQILSTRPELEELRQAAPDLASRFEALTRMLSEDDAVRQAGIEPSSRHHCAEELKSLVKRIQSTPGFATFGAEPSAAELRAAGQSGPIVSINLSDRSSHALILHDTEIKRVQLSTDLGPEAIGMVTHFVKALEVLSSGPGFAQQQQAEATVRLVLTWAHHEVTGPVLDMLGLAPEKPESCPRLWWAPGGLLGLLPLHAAGDYRSERPIITADRVMSSYTPSIRQLARSRTPRVHIERLKGMAVAMRCTPGEGYPDLHAAAKEVEFLRGKYPSVFAEEDSLIDDQAVRATVIDRLRSCSIAHFACHSSSEPADPAASRMVLSDHLEYPLDVQELARLDLSHTRLAYLSACRTAQHTNGAMLDESLHFAAACQVAGFQHAVGTLWAVNDQAAQQFSESFYRNITDGRGELDPGLAGRAVHMSMHERRADNALHHPSSWAGWVHYGC